MNAGEPLDGDTITTIWLIAGITMMLSEMIVPGMVIGFLGFASVLVAGARALGIVESLGASVGLWTVTSVGLVLSLRNVAKKYFPSEEKRVSIDEDASMYGKEVQVLSDCSDANDEGRIRIQGTSWPAKTVEGTIAAGTTAKLVYRDNVAWIIEPLEVAGQLESGERPSKVPVAQTENEEAETIETPQPKD